MEISPYLSAIQSLSGKNPAAKYQELHAAAKQLIEPSKERGIAAAVTTSTLPPALHPLLRILIGIMLKSREEVIEALKSEDLTVRNQAFRAKWFFDGSDESLNADFFLNEVMPFVSVHARKKIIKALSSNLRGKSEIGDVFFKTFLKAYGLQKSLALLIACKEDTIFNIILKHKITLTRRQLRFIFQVHPKLIIGYLREGFLNQENSKVPRLRSWSTKYKFILPFLIRDYPNDFLDLCKEVRNVKIGYELQNYLLKDHIDKLIANPEVFISLFSLQTITEKLTPQQFEVFFGNIHATTCCDVSIMLDYLKYYPKDKRLPLLKKKHKLKFNEELLDDLEYIKSYELLELVSLEEKQKIGRRIVDSTPKTSLNYFRWCCYLPPGEAFIIFKSEIAHSSDANTRLNFFKKMIKCCVVNENKDYLLKFLNFYNDRHKNERASVLHEVLEYIGKEVPHYFLDKSHWAVLRKIMFRSYIKKELFDSQVSLFFESALYHLLVQCENEILEGDVKKFLDEVIDIILEYCVEHGFKTIVYVSEPPEVTKKCFDKFLSALPLKYPDEHAVWKNDDNNCDLSKKTYYVFSIIKVINNINEKYAKKNKKSRPKKLSLLYFPWLVNAIKSILSKKEGNMKYVKDIKELVQKMESELYNSIIITDLLMQTGESSTESVTEKIKSGAVLKSLQTNPASIYKDWLEYFSACQKLIKYYELPMFPIRRFIRASKWHQNLPLHFVTHCLKDLRNSANIIILGLLLEGEVLSKILSQIIPEISKFEAGYIDDPKVYEIIVSIPVAIDVTNPPVTLQFLETFCREDFVRFAVRSVVKVSQRITIPKAKQFAKLLINKPVSVQRYGFYMYLRLANEEEQLEFLSSALKTMKHPTMHEMTVKTISGFFGSSPSETRWKLMKECIAGLTSKNSRLLQVLCEYSENWACNHDGLFYIELFLEIEELAKSGDIDENSIKSYLSQVLRSMYNKRQVKGLPDEKCKDILQRHLFEENFTRMNSKEWRERILGFAVRNYIFETPEKFEFRLNIVNKFLLIIIKEWNLKDPNDPQKYPVNFALRVFFKELFDSIEIKFLKFYEWNKLSKPFRCMLNIFSTILSPSQEISSYLKLYFFDLYSANISWKDYGFKCGQNLSNLVQDFSSELILEDVDDSLYFIVNCISQSYKMLPQNITNMMTGLCEVNSYYAAFVCIKLLKRIDFSDTKDKCLKIIDQLQKNNNIIVKSNLNDFINSFED